jgi:hypothetical protein
LLALLLGALSPAYLTASRRSLTEALALAPVILAVAAALQYRRRGRRGWLLVAGLLLSIGIAIKPIVLPAAVPVGLALSGAGRAWRRDALVVAASAGLSLLLIVLLVGPAGVLRQIVEYRLQARQSWGWSLAGNWAVVSGVLDDEPLALFALALAGSAALIRLAPGAGWPLLGWALASLGLLILHAPLFAKHPVILVPPLAALAGGLGTAWSRRRELPRLVEPALALGAGLLLVTLPATLAADRRVVGLDPAAPPVPSAAGLQASTIAALAPPDRFVLTDTPFLPYLADRLVPPPLTDLSSTRIGAGALSTEELVAAADRYPVGLAVLRTDWFRQLAGFNAWLAREFVLVRISGRGAATPDLDLAPFLYVRRPVDLGAVRAILTGGLTQSSGVEFDQKLRLLHFDLAETPAGRGRRLNLTIEWEMLATPDGDPRTVLQLVGPTGRPVDSVELPFGDGVDGPTSWSPGRWLVQQANLTLPAALPGGEYRLALGVFDAAGRRALTVSRSADAPGSLGDPTVTLWRTGGG